MTIFITELVLFKIAYKVFTALTFLLYFYTTKAIRLKTNKNKYCNRCYTCNSRHYYPNVDRRAFYKEGTLRQREIIINAPGKKYLII
jgi:hypothetical protein